MGHPQKPGIDYAGWNTNIFEGDVKIDQLIEAQGWNGFSVYFYLCQKAYATDGYYYTWSYANAATTARRMGGGIGSETVIQTVGACLRIGLFDKRLFDVGSILTSKGIQRKYAQAIQRRRKKIVKKEYWLLDEEETASYEITFAECDADINLRNANKRLRNAEEEQPDAVAPKSKVKESKVKESKEKEKEKGAAEPRRVTAKQMILEAGFSPAMEQAVSEWVKYKTEKRQPYKETGLKSLLTMVRNQAKARGEGAVIEAINQAMASNWQGFHFDSVGARSRSDRIKNRVQEVDNWNL